MRRVAAALLPPKFPAAAAAASVRLRAMKRVIVLGCAVATLAAPSTAGAATCRFTDVDGFPAVHGGQAHGVGCTTARAVGNAIQRGYARTGRQPERLRANGMRFRCRYRFYTEGDGQLQRATCRRASRPTQRVVLALSA